MRIARTTGVSDAIVKVRRGISLRTVREEPKKATNTVDLAKGLQAGSAGKEPFSNTIDFRGLPSIPQTSTVTEQPQRAEYRIEEVPEDRRVARYDTRVLRLQYNGSTDLRQVVNDMAGPVPNGYTREIWEDNGFRGNFLVVEDRRPRHVRRVPIPQPVISVGHGDPNGDYSVICVSIPYEVVEDVSGGGDRSRARGYLEMPVAFWRAAARHAGFSIPEGYDNVDIDQDLRIRSFSAYFNNRGSRR